MLRTLVFLPERPWKKVAVVRGVDVFFCRFGGVSVTGKRRTARGAEIPTGRGTDVMWAFREEHAAFGNRLFVTIARKTADVPESCGDVGEGKEVFEHWGVPAFVPERR